MVGIPISTKMELLPALVKSNPVKGLQYTLFEIPVISIEAKHNDELQWGMYWNLFNILLVTTGVLFFSKRCINWQRLTKKQQATTVIALFSIYFVSIDLWLNGCCSVRSGWLPEILLLSKAYNANPYTDVINWQWLYLNMAKVAPLLKTIILATVLWHWHRLRQTVYR